MPRARSRRWNWKLHSPYTQTVTADPELPRGSGRESAPGNDARNSPGHRNGSLHQRQCGGRPPDEIYERNTRFLRDRFEAYANGGALTARVRATYPFVRITTSTYARLEFAPLLRLRRAAGRARDHRDAARPVPCLSHRADQALDREPWRAGRNRRVERADPNPFRLSPRHQHRSATQHRRQVGRHRPLRDVFDTPDLAAMDDAIANGTLELPPGAPEPLALFRAARVDYSLHRLYHYTGTDPEHFQNFVIFTNYQFYVDAFAQLVPRAHGVGPSRPGSLRRAGQRDHPQCSPRRRHSRALPPSACRRCRLFIWSSPAIAASP